MKALLPVIVTGLLGALALSACSKSQPEPVSATSPDLSTGAGAATVGSTPAVTPGAKPAAAATTRASVLHPALLDPSKATEKAPDVFKAQLDTTKGTFVIEVHRDWSPNGADRFYNLVKLGYFDDTRFFRAVEGFMVQFGLSGDPVVNAKWQNANIPDDPVKQSNKRGYVTFAQTNAPGSRSTQIFINYGDNSRLDAMRFVPFGQVTKGMDVVDSLYKGYGEGAPGGHGPSQGQIQLQGNAYLDKDFPRLDGVKHAEIVP